MGEILRITKNQIARNFVLAGTVEVVINNAQTEIQKRRAEFNESFRQTRELMERMKQSAKKEQRRTIEKTQACQQELEQLMKKKALLVMPEEYPHFRISVGGTDYYSLTKPEAEKIANHFRKLVKNIVVYSCVSQNKQYVLREKQNELVFNKFKGIPSKALDYKPDKYPHFRVSVAGLDYYCFSLEYADKIEKHYAKNFKNVELYICESENCEAQII